MDFVCPKCTAKNQNVNTVGCAACGFGKHQHQENRARTVQKPVVEAPPGFTGTLLTEDC